MKKYLIAIAAAAFLALTPAFSSAGFLTLGDSFTLDKLIGGQTITAGDKLFSGFTYTKSGDMPVASAITVQNIIDSSGNYGLLFTGNFQDLIGTAGASDGLLSFNVSVLDPSKLIVGVNLFGNPTVTGTGVASITETFLPLPGSMNIFDNTSHTGVNSNTHTFVTGQKKISVQKDILAFVANGNSTASITEFGQTFIQTPLPASLVMLLTGALTAVPAYRLSRRKN